MRFLRRRLAAVALLAALVGSVSAMRLPPDGAKEDDAACRNLLSGNVVLDPQARLSFSSEPQSTDAVAWGSYVDGQHTVSNFGQLRISTSGRFSDAQQMRGAGYLEGWLTAPRIYDNWQNMDAYFREYMNASLEEPMHWIKEQHGWVRKQCSRLEAGASPEAASGQPGSKGADGLDNQRLRRVWQSVCLVLQQYDGVKEGYRAARAEREAQAGSGGSPGFGALSDDDFLFVQSNADLYDIIDWLQPDQRPSWVQSTGAPSSRAGGSGWESLSQAAQADPKGTAARLFNRVALSGKCTALVKVSADLSDLFMGHSTWDTYTAMLRIFKHYEFDLRELKPAANRVSFSSYPSELFSDDDFFMLSSKLVILQTTNKIFNDELFERLDTRTVPSWLRVRTANFLATSGEDWAQYLQAHNSGTYNNQYLVVDLDRFVPGEELREGLLTVVEQIPGLVQWADGTDRLGSGYFPSYNVPYFKRVYNESGYPDFISKLEKYGQHFAATTHWLSYEQTPRAKIFRRDQTKVTDLESMAALMRYNDWKHDPLSEGHPIASICGRGDLDPENPVPRGCFDSKVTSYRLALKLEATAVNGPTRGELHPHPLPAFAWPHQFPAHQFPELQHNGQPDNFEFAFERMSPDELGGCRPPQWSGSGSNARVQVA